MRMIERLLWLGIWLGGLALAGRHYERCLDEGTMIPGCDHSIEYLAWAASLFGLIMFARSLRTASFFKKWLQ